MRMMNKVVPIALFFRTCENCRYWKGVKGSCGAPGGWKASKKLECLTFRFSERAIREQRMALGK